MSLKKLPIETIKLIPGHIALDKVDFWFQDEARVGQQNTTTRLWAQKGSRPRAFKQQQFEYVYMFGAVCPADGRTEALLVPWVNKDIMRQHLIWQIVVLEHTTIYSMRVPQLGMTFG